MDWKLALVVLLINCPMSFGNMFDNQGKEFIIAFMENSKGDQNLELFVTTFVDDLVNVTVSAPKYSGNASLHQQIQVSKGSTALVSIDVELQMEGSSMSPKGIVIQATDEVAIYGVNRQEYTNDAFLGLPTEVLGQEYYAVTFLPTATKSYAQYAQLMVVATVDVTQVQITFPESNDFNKVTFDGREYQGGETLTVIMNSCDALQLQAEGYFDLTGAYLKSDKPVAFFSGNIRAVVGVSSSSDHLVEQLMSTDRWGKRFVISPIPAREVGDYVKVTGNMVATAIDITCISIKTSIITSERIILVKAGSYQLVEMNPESHCYVVANNSILVVYFVKSDQNRDNHDPALIMIPPIEQYGAEYVFTTPRRTNDDIYENFFLFVVKDQDKDGLRLDGNPFPSTIDYVSIPNSSLVAGYMMVEDGFHRFNHISPISVFGGIIYGRYPYESYGLPVGLRMAEINQPCTVTDGAIADGRDNDCDGLIDEELCTGTNAGQDDDDDGSVDEDCAKAWPDDWDEWGTWGECIQKRNRTCNVPNTGESNCPGSNSESISCEKTESATYSNSYIALIAASTSTASTLTAGSPSTASTKVKEGNLNEIMEEMKKSLRVDRKSTSQYRRSLSSTYDERTSSAIIGYVFIGVVASVLTAILFLDLGTCFYQVRNPYKIHAEDNM